MQDPHSHARAPKPAFHVAASLLVAWAGCLGTIAPAQATEWPAIVMPKEAHGFDVGRQVTLNGMPMRMQGFVSELPPRAAADAFRQLWGKPLVEMTQGGKLILGRAQDEHYLVVQIEPAAGGSRGIVALSHLKAANDRQASVEAAAQRWLDRLPAGSRLVSDMESEDAGRLSRHLVFSNAQGEPLNRDRIISLLADKGFVLERESVPGEPVAPTGAAPLANARVLFFKGAQKEAIASIHQDANGQTTTVLNLVNRLEQKP